MVTNQYSKSQIFAGYPYRLRQAYSIQSRATKIPIVTKWLLTLLLGLFLLGLVSPMLKRIGIGRLPGDLHFRHKGRAYYFPFTSSVLLSIFLSILFGLLK